MEEKSRQNESVMNSYMGISKVMPKCHEFSRCIVPSFAREVEYSPATQCSMSNFNAPAFSLGYLIKSAPSWSQALYELKKNMKQIK